MKKFSSLSAILCLMSLLFSCSKESKSAPQPAGTEKTTEKLTSEISLPKLKGDHCFVKAENKDTTSVHLSISATGQIKGEMRWQPWEKDGAVGTLSGKLISENEMDLLYDYTIEGSQQTETKIMKIENDKLYLKNGELTDPKNDGHLVYKNPSKAAYSEVLDKTSCP
ncbi:hypothetical protein [uncultured Chryseobacterium sp.]|uniref:hypothetical protein n=1 Tax=uncultured Chryseobacterium sp. TaxID=259322 RepID=UPI0025F9318F|nr:hypothetical protein [uncultured Chryseobacterium sp.]